MFWENQIIPELKKCLGCSIILPIGARKKLIIRFRCERCPGNINITSAKENNKTTINTFGIFEKIFPVVPGIKYIGMKAAIVVSIVINTGELIRIPTNTNKIIRKFKQLNGE